MVGTFIEFLISSHGRSSGRTIVLPPVSASALANCKIFFVKVFYVMSKALSCELSCPCDRSCLALLVTMHRLSKEDFLKACVEVVGW